MAKAQILVVEDDGVVAMDTKSRLKNLGYAVSAIVPSGEEAIEKVKETSPDLVLMDIKLKGEMDGFEAARQILARFDIPIIYMTGYPPSKTKPHEYLIKPVDSIDLERAIDSVLHEGLGHTGEQSGE